MTFYGSVLKYLLLSPTRNCVSLGLCFLIWEAGKVRLENCFQMGVGGQDLGDADLNDPAWVVGL